MSQKKGSKKGQNQQQQREKEEMQEMRKLDTTGLKQEIYQLRQQLSYLIHQKSTVESQMLKSNDKYMKDSFEIEKTIKIQQQELVDLENNYKLLKNTFEENRRKNQTDWDSEQEAGVKKRSQEKENINKKIRQLQKKVDYLKKFRERQIQYLDQLKKLQEKEEANKWQQRRDIEKIVEQHEGKRTQLKQNVEKEIQSIKQLEVNKLEQKMNKQQQLRRENDLIQEEIALCEHEKGVLEEEYKQLLHDKQSSRSLNANSLLEGQATQTYERSLRVIKLENKLAKMKSFMQEEITRLQGQCSRVQQQAQGQKKDLESKVQKLESWLKLKDKDYKKIKACSQMVLNQRSNLEAYLLEVFHEHSELDYKDPANTNQILRYLFIKINSRKPPTSYKDYLLSTQQSQISKKSL